MAEKKQRAEPPLHRPTAVAPVAGPHALSVSNLAVSYRRREVLRGLDLEIAPGAIYGLLGPNGAGKTTLIRAICGRVNRASGEILITGDSNRHRSTLRQIGLVPQEIALYMHLTARENLVAFGRLSGLSAQETREAIDWAAEATHLTERLRDRVDILSGGWKRRVNIAAAILHRPALLILDEPTVGVDVDARNDLHEVIRDLSAAGMGVLLATHDLDQAETLCSTVGFLRNGLIDPQGAPRALIEEAFGDRKEIILELRRPLKASQKRVLLASGFLPSNVDMTWSVLGDVDDTTSGGLSGRLEKVGILVREIRFREPGLDSLFLHLNRGTEIGSGGVLP